MALSSKGNLRHCPASLHSHNYLLLLCRDLCQRHLVLKNVKMWPIIIQFLRSNAPYFTLPVAAVVGVIGYNVEGLLSDRYTPYNKPVQDQRVERLTDEDLLNDPTNVKKLKYHENVLGRNVSPSLQSKD